MQLVIADTSPVNYLILIGQIDVLPVLFDHVILPAAVRDELNAPKAPAAVQRWIAASPAWILVRTATGPISDPAIRELDCGESDALTLAIELHADLLLVDDREAVAVARDKGLRVAGTLTVLAMAAQKGLLNLRDAVDRLKLTSFHYRQEFIDRFLADQGF